MNDATPKEVAPPSPKREVKKALADHASDSNNASFISKPFNFEHKFKVKLDPRSSTGFKVRARARTRVRVRVRVRVRAGGDAGTRGQEVDAGVEVVPRG